MYPMISKPEVKKRGKINEQSYEDHLFSMNNHVGTHLAASSHMLA